MAKLKNPLLSLGAQGSLARAITFLRRRKQDIVEKMPVPDDAKSQAQLSWRHMYQKCAALWHDLSASEQREWNALGGIRHMTGFAYWQSQCLRPNPGIYLPLQGGTMQGDIDMAKYRLLRLPLPADSQEPLTLAYHTANILPYLGTDTCRVFHSVDQPIPHASTTLLVFDSELWDTNNLHSTTVNPQQLKAQKAGYYLVSLSIAWEGNPNAYRRIIIEAPGPGWIAVDRRHHTGAFDCEMTVTTVIHRDIGQYVQSKVYQNSGVALDVKRNDNLSAHFMMALIGA